MTLRLFAFCSLLLATCAWSAGQEEEKPPADTPTTPAADVAPGDPAAGAPAQDPKNEGEKAEGEEDEGQEPSDGGTTPAAASPGKGTVRLHLMEGSVVSGKLSVESITVTTEFGKLEVPVNRIVSFTPGLESHPKERDNILRLIEQLGSKTAQERDDAQRKLSEVGLPVREELEKYRDDEDAERRTRVEKILAEMEELAEEQEEEGVEMLQLIPEDTVETMGFTVVGDISPKTFEMQTKFGQLTVNLADVRRVERESDEKPEERKSLSVEGEYMVPANMKSAGIRVARGDRVVVRADGNIIMSPWGNTASSTPDGSEQYQWYIPGKIATGALCAKIGSSGKVFKVGSKYTFTATRGGVLYFGMAMNPQYANQGYQFPGQYNLKIRVNPQD